MSTKARLSRAAENQFAERGYRSARLSDIAADAGLTTGAVYASFVGTEALYQSLVDAYDAALDAELRQAPDLTSATVAWARIASANPGVVRATMERSSVRFWPA